LTTLNIALVFFCDTTKDKQNPDLEGMRRLEKAIALYQIGAVNRIMVTGGLLGNIRQNSIYVTYLANKGIPVEDIIQETESDTTATNIQYTSEKLGAIISSGVKIDKIYLISNFRHLRRIKFLIWRQYWYWPWKNELASILIDENVSPRLLEFIKLIATILDPVEKSWWIKRFKKKRASNITYKGF